MTSTIKVDNIQNQNGETFNIVSWDTTPKTTGFTAVSGNGYFCDTTSAAFTVTLPASPSARDIVAIADYNGTAGTNNITVGRNSSNINGSATDFKISINYASISFVYVDATAGWRSVDTSDTSSLINPFVSATGGTITTCGDFKIHTFTGPGTFTVNTSGPGSSTVDYLVVAGGGGGGGNPGNGGGGGSGGFRTNFPSSCAGVPVTAQAYPITVGAGGAVQTNGNNSIFSTITSTAGGSGAPGGLGGGGTGNSGGSGGGGGGTNPGPGGAGGSGNSPPTSPSQGNNGGAGAGGITAGGGGGAGAVGGNSNGTVGGNGGNGTANSITGSPVTYAGGGGGGIWNGVTGPGGTGGSGGGGNGPIPPAGADGVAAVANTGGGGGGGGTSGAGAAGGSGIVVIRYRFQ